MRDKEGNALRNSHVVGFFRRICKLLFFGIKPVFVFDGGAPILKRQTIGARKARREGRREDAVRTAGKLLAVQMQRRAEEDERKRREERDKPAMDMAEEEVPDDLVYVDELQMSAQERQQKRTFKKQDAYHLPDLPTSLSEMGGPDDPRIMSPEELEEYARQFHTGEDINIYDFSKIDFNSQFFVSLPATDRYNILNAARLRSRLRMGYSKDQLDTMFPDRMAFSKFQIERVRERNELTQRLMNLNGMNGVDGIFNMDGGGRVAGERGKEYVLVKNDGVEGGWALGVVSNKGEGERNRPIDVETFGTEAAIDATEEDEVEEDDFEDVPIEGLNRLPRRTAETSKKGTAQRKTLSETIDKRKALYQARQHEAGISDNAAEAVDEDPDSLFIPQVFVEGSSEKDEVDALFEDVPLNDMNEDEELQKAIAMSLEDLGDELTNETQEPLIKASYASPAVDKPLDFNQKNAKVGRDFAHQTNARAMGFAPLSREKSASGDDIGVSTPIKEPLKSLTTNTSNSSKTVSFDGPLPFESINLGKSVFGRKKKNAVEEGGGFEIEPAPTEEKQQDLPPWFSAGVAKEDYEWKDPKEKQSDNAHASIEEANIHHRARLNRHETGEIIDLDVTKPGVEEVIEVISSDDGADEEVRENIQLPVDSEIRMGDTADLTRAEPPAPILSALDSPVRQEDQEAEVPPMKSLSQHELDSDEPIEWEESDLEDQGPEASIAPNNLSPGGSKAQRTAPLSSPSESEFEEVDINSIDQAEVDPKESSLDQAAVSPLPNADTFDDMQADNGADMYSDTEEEDLMRQMAVEAEEHARFSATLNPQSHLQSAEDYEKELRQLRNQQKKDRRDADEVSQIMVTECQQLLKLFGLPYVTAPMEAEAQCAELVNLGLVDGIVTDDSDVFLFGGTRVYKNMFNQAKFVECYLASDLEKEYSLTRPKLVSIAHLLGSDYTEGLPSVGPVTALEILSEFETLEAFSDWWAVVQLGQPASSVDTASSFRKKFRKNAAKIFLPNGFPDKRVDEAYLHPEVDHDPSPFAWGVPDLDALRSFLMATIGWSQERTDEVLVPVVKDMNRRELEGTQANITQFFEGSVGIGANKRSTDGAFAPRRVVEKSKRMTTALGRLHARAKDRTTGEDEAEVEHRENMAINESSSVSRDHGERSADVADRPQPMSNRKHRMSKKRPRRESTLSEGSQNDDEDDYAAPKRSRKSTKGTKSRNEKASG